MSARTNSGSPTLTYGATWAGFVSLRSQLPAFGPCQRPWLMS
jgi:hypothetical protein